jgi:DNA-binding transcriptional ArsR family regulator
MRGRQHDEIRGTSLLSCSTRLVLTRPLAGANIGKRDMENGMLRIHFNADDFSRIRFATAPAPVLETTLMLRELRSMHRQAPARNDWCNRVRERFPQASLLLLNLVPAGTHALYLDVLTADHEKAFHRVSQVPQRLHENNPGLIEQTIHWSQSLSPPSVSAAWLSRYARSDPGALGALDGGLRAFYRACLRPQWSRTVDFFYADVERQTSVMRDQGTRAMLAGLHPDLHFNGLTLESAHPPWSHNVDLGGNGLILMPSASWSGHPCCTWDPQDPSQFILIYPGTRPLSKHPGYYPQDPATALAALLGSTRAAVLAVLRSPLTTSGIASQVGISVSTASDHAAALRNAGLISSQRTGQAVQHSLTRLGYCVLTRRGPARGVPHDPDGG